MSDKKPFNEDLVKEFEETFFPDSSAFNVSFSASFWDCPEVREVLHMCDIIYTTQAQNWPVLVEFFGRDKVRVIPDGSNSLMDFLIKRLNENEESLQIIRMCDLMKLRDRAESSTGNTTGDS